MATVDVNCQKCNKGFSVDTEYFEIFGKEPYCQDCLIHTQCQSCNRYLRIEPSAYQQVGGDPVICEQCAQSERATSSNTGSSTTTSSSTGSSSNSFWQGLTIGEKIVFPILVLLLISILGFLALAEMQGYDANAGVLPAGLIFLIYWTYRRGKKNK